MKKSTKGAIAAAAAGTLLVGGTGSLAYWTATGTVAGGQINSGNIALTSPVCDKVADTDTHNWEYDGGSVFTPGTSKIVPGDSISKVCKMTLTLVGDHIGAGLGLSTPSFAQGGDSNLITALSGITAVFTVDGATQTSITEPGTYVILATVTVPFDTAATNNTKDVTATLNNLTLTATQTHDAS